MRASAAGSLPGTDFRGALRFVLEEFSLAPWPELPARGAGSGMIGRAAALLSDLPVELTSAGWRLSSHADAGHRRARAAWRSDLDDAEELAQDFTGVLKIGVCGPLTLAACLQRPRAEAAIADAGARRDIAQALAEGLRTLRAELARRLPGAGLMIQIDEPMLPAILGGQVPSASGVHRLPAVDAAEAAALLSGLDSGMALHCCAPGTVWEVASAAGFGAVHLDLSAPSSETLDALGSWLDAGNTVLAGLLDTAAIDAVPAPDALLRGVLGLTERLRADPGEVDARVVLAPVCGFAGWSRDGAARAMKTLSRAAALAGEALAGRAGLP
ncbi:MAG: methionine synthase [Propionibacteriaceae bacterium]|nr:methionine synthase [Propionibacteriaceae bacterium]